MTYKNYGCSKLEKVTISSSVEYIGNNTFRGCPLKEVRCYAKTPPRLNGYVFPNAGVPKLYVPKGTRQAYVLSTWGSYFKEIIEMEE